jgi:hypothetical protein
MTARTKQRYEFLLLMAVGILGCILISIAASGCSGSAKMRTLRTTLVAVDAARVGVETYDRAHQVALIDEAKSREEALAKIQAYRERRTVVVEAFTVVYKAIAAAALDPTDVNYLEAIKQANDLYQSIKAFKEAVTGKAPKVDLAAPPGGGS